MSDQNNEQAIEIAALQRKVLDQVRHEDKLQRKIDTLTERRESNPKRKENQDVRTILETHRRLTAMHKRKRDEPVDMDSDDAMLVRKQLKRYTAVELLEAVQGKALRPYFRNYQHYPKPPGKRQVTMRHCIGTDEWIARNREWWQAAQEAALHETEAMFRTWLEIAALHSHWQGLVLGAVCRREWSELPVDVRARCRDIFEAYEEIGRAEPSFIGVPAPEPLADVIPINREAA